MGEMPSYGGEPDKRKTPRKSENQPLNKATDDVNWLTGDGSVPGLESEEMTSAQKIQGLDVEGGMIEDFESASDVARKKTEEMHARETKRFDTVDFTQTPDQILNAYMDHVLSNPDILSLIIKEVDPDIKGFRRTMREATIEGVKVIQKNVKPGESQQNAMLALDKLFKDRLSRMRRV